MQVRPRRYSDLDACEQLMRAVHENDGYPRRLPSDLRGFIVWPSAIRAWVADVDGAVVGHVALRATGSREVMNLAASVIGIAPEWFGVVARLVVSPTVRRQGVGRSLLETATEHAAAVALTPILEVTTNLRAAIDLYETCGWLRMSRPPFVGVVRARWSTSTCMSPQSPGDWIADELRARESALGPSEIRLSRRTRRLSSARRHLLLSQRSTRL